MSRRRFRVVPLVIGIALFLAILFAAGAERVEAVLDADLRWVGAAAAAGFLVTLVSTFRWGAITNALAGRHVLSWPGYWAALMSSRVLGLFFPRAASDLGVRYVAVTRTGGMGAEPAAASVALDQLFDLALLLAWLAPTLFALGGLGTTWTLGLLTVATVVAIGLMLRLGRFARWLSSVLARASDRLGAGEGRVGGFFRRRADGFRSLADEDHMTPRQSAAIAVATLVRYGLNAVMFWAISQSLGLDIGLDIFVLAGAGVQLSLVVAVTPGGLGIMDLGWVGLLALGGADTAAVAAFIVGQRAFQYVFFPAMAGISWVVTASRPRVADP